MMENIAEIIKKTRESKGLTLENISVATKIRVNVLKAIEEGNFNILPKVYMLSFLKEYLKFLGLNVNEYKEEIEKIFGAEKKALVAKQDELTFYQPLRKKKKVRYTPEQLNKALYFIYGAIFLSLLAILYFTLFYSEEEQKPLELGKTADTLVVSAEPTKGVALLNQTQDSIKLEFFAKDTVWLNMVIDNKYSEKLILYPNSSKQWKAGNFFKFTLGNAGGVVIKRNDVELPPLAKGKVAVKNIIVTKDKYYIEPAPKPKQTTEELKKNIILTPAEIKKEIPSLRDTKKIKTY
ncbi:MAG: helix-turn-helix domain-containing protein [Candidatus Kapaibacteriota bacterium]|jgi:transcriptional regulator with XRE-family HTH domain